MGGLAVDSISTVLGLMKKEIPLAGSAYMMLDVLILVSSRPGRLNTFHMMKTDDGNVVNIPTTPMIVSADTCILVEIRVNDVRESLRLRRGT